MPGNVLVDSSFLIGRLRAGADPLRELSEYADEWDFVTCGVVLVEVLRGMKLKPARDRMAAFLGCMHFVSTLDHVWDRVHRLAWELDRAGQTMQVTDLVIAVSAAEADAFILTFDADFLRVPGARVVRALT